MLAPTQQHLLSVLSYSPTTGRLTWRVEHQKVKVGDRAGSPHNDGYRAISLGGRKYLEHRVIWCMVEGYWPEHEVDHLNRVRDDNRWSNLDHKTQSCNLRNGKVRKDNSSGIPGVSWNKREKKFRVRIADKGKRVLIGDFNSFTQAVEARHRAEILYGYEDCHQGLTAAAAYLKSIEGGI